MNEERIEGIFMNRNVAKRFCLTLFFGANLENMKETFNIHEIPSEIEELNIELQTIINTIINLECNKPIQDFVKKLKEEKKDTSNIRGSTFSYIIQDVERQLFDILQTELNKSGFTVGAYIYDGCHVEKHETKKLKVYLKVLSGKLTKFFNDKDVLPIKLEIKPMELDLSYLDVEEQYKLYMYHKATMVNNNIFKINNPICFYDGKVLVDACDMPLIQQEELCKIYRNFGNIQLYNMKTPKRFIDMWLDDKFIKTYDRITFCPNENSPLFKNPNVLNKFDGFEILKHSFDDLPTTQEERKEYCNVIFEYLNKVCNNASNIKWMITWISSILKSPYIKTGCMPLFKGKAGLGKTTLFYLIQEIIGRKYCLESSDLDKDIFASHAHGRVNKLLILLDEISFRSASKYTEQMKTAISSKTMNVNPKGIDAYEYDSYENYMGCSNNDIPIDINEDNRRYIIIDVEKNDFGNAEQKSEFFKQLYSSVIGSEKDNIKPNFKILRCFYDYMMNYDNGGFILENNVNTGSTLSISRKPILDEFLNDKLFKLYKNNRSMFYDEGKNEFSLSSTTLYNEFSDYCKSMNLKDIMSGTLFSTKIKKYDFLTSKRTSLFRGFLVDLKKYCEYFDFNISDTDDDNIEIEM